MRLKVRSTWAPRCSLVALATCLWLGCAADLENPGQYLDDGDVDCSDVPKLLVDECGGDICHGQAQPAANLDLESPDVADRLLGVASACNERPFVDPSSPTESYFIEKLTESEPECGSQMPLARPSLSADQVACISTWLEEQSR